MLLDAVEHLLDQNSKKKWAAIFSKSSTMKTMVKNTSRLLNISWALDSGEGLISFSAMSQAKLPMMTATQKICVGFAQYNACT